ncbi:beta-aspartyl-peptidase [bacterium]|nr:beta-aspartyl-peptidase [bacterium]
MLKLLSNVHVFAPENRGLQHVLVAAGKLVYMGATEPTLDPCLEVERIDFEGARLVPGFIDAHAHVTGGGGEAGFETAVPAPFLSEFTSAGVTTVVGLLGTDDLVRSTSALIARIKALRAEGLSAFGYTGGYHFPPTTLTGSVRSDLVHIEELIAVGEIAISDHRSSQPTFEEVLRLASEAHVAGLMTGKAGLVHFHVGDGSRGLELIRRALAESEIPARTFYPTHVNRKKALFAEACLLTKQGCPIDVTAFPVEEGEDAFSAEDAWTLYHKEGYAAERITISSDGGGCLPKFDENGHIAGLDYAKASALPFAFKSLLDAGNEAETVLPAFTSNVADILRLNQKGRIKIGADADLVILGSDHLPSWVMAQGTWHVRNNKVTVKGTFE